MPAEVVVEAEEVEEVLVVEDGEKAPAHLQSAVAAARLQRCAERGARRARRRQPRPPARHIHRVIGADTA